MATQASLHGVRQRIGSNRQPSHRKDLRELHDTILSLGLRHPYELGYEDRIELEKKSAYARAGQGPDAIVNAKYLYRITGAKALAYSVTNLILRGITRLDNNEVIWGAFNDMTDQSSWRSLSRYAEGTLTGRRSITWWTSTAIRPENVVSRSYQMGMYDIWIPVYALLLRCPTASVTAQQVPTILDAFDQEVFHPTKYLDDPKTGITINLERAGKLTKGLEEFVLGPISVDIVEVLPVLVDTSMRLVPTPVEQGAAAWGLLEKYLRSL